MKVALITGSRADRAALEMVEAALKPNHETRWIVFGALPPADRWDVSRNAWEALEEITRELWGAAGGWMPDLVIVHGDRYEILAATMAANILGLPIAHLGGGDLTEGSQDDCFRHAITKLSHLHFPTNADAGIRIEQMGEDPSRVHVVGDPGIDLLMQTPLMGRDETFAAVSLAVCDRLLLVVFHPNTLGDTAAELDALTVALRRQDAAIVLIGPNADAGSNLIRNEWTRLSQYSRRAIFHENLARPLFLSLLKHCDMLIGNSSAGFYEAPCFGTPAINIGDRQQGRTKPSNVMTVHAEAAEISKGINGVLHFSGFGKLLQVANPYGDGHAAERIAKVIAAVGDPKALLRKRFVEREMARELIHAIGMS